MRLGRRQVNALLADGTLTQPLRGVYVFGEPPLQPADVVLVAGLRCTTPKRTAADLARWLLRPMGLAEPATESFGESWLRLRILDAGLPRPQAQVWVRDLLGHRVYRLDLAYPALRIGLEYDGDAHHGSSANVTKDDVRRDRLRRELGWQVTGLHRGHVLGQQMHLEQGVGELLGQAPTTIRRTW